MTTGANIRRIRKDKGLTLNQLAAMIESDVGNLSRLERGQQGYSDAMLSKISQALQVPVALFFMDEGQAKALQAAAVRPVEVVTDDDPRWVHIRKVKLKLTAGFNEFETEPEIYDGETLAVPSDWVKRRGYDPAMLLAIRVRGESMEPTLFDGDGVVVNTVDKHPVDGAVYAFNYEGDSVVKRMMRDAGEWWLTSDSPDKRKYERRVCRGEACLIIGRVVRRESERL